MPSLVTSVFHKDEIPLASIERLEPTFTINGLTDVPDWLFDELAPLYAERGFDVTVHVCKLCGDHWQYRRAGLAVPAGSALRTRVGVHVGSHCYPCEQALRGGPDIVRLIEKVAHYAARSAAEEVVAKHLGSLGIRQAERMAEALTEAESQLELTQASLDEK
jgi:hypothetical protein